MSPSTGQFTVRFTEEAEADLLRLYDYLIERDPGGDPHLAGRALEGIAQGTEMLRRFPYSCRKAVPDTPYLRELVIPFGASATSPCSRSNRATSSPCWRCAIKESLITIE